MKNSPQRLGRKGKHAFIATSIASILLMTQSGLAAPGDKVHAYFADEHNTTATSSTGNRILEIDIENMTLVNSLDVPGILGHHADNGFNSKIYGVPKGSGFVNVIELRKDQNDTTSMENTKQINLTHMPRSGDAYNKKFNVVLMVARNRPMGSFINVETDQVVGTIGENVDCTLTDGSRLLSHTDANTIAGATKYQCQSVDHGGDQISGHPYWLTSDYAAIVDRTNHQISLYFVWKEGSQLKSRLVNHLQTRTSIHQIVPRDRTNLPGDQQADFYAVEEGKHANNIPNDLSGGIAHALLHMKLTTTGLQLVRRMDLQRTDALPTVQAQRIIDECVANYRNTNNYRNGRSRTQAYDDLFAREGISKSLDQDPGADFPVECFYPGIPGGHNADFAPNNKHVYVGMAGGAVSVIDVNRWKIVNNLDIGIRSGPGHTCFSEKHNLALTTNHGVAYTRVIRNINTDRPTIAQFLPLGFTREGLINTYQSHTCYIDEKEEFYYNFWTDGGVFYKMNLADIAANTQNGNPNMVADSLVTGGIPIQGSYIYLKSIKNENTVVFKANNDTAKSDGSAINIDVLKNDTGISLELEYADGADHGQVEVVNGFAKYTPNYGFSGKDGFWYGVSSPGYEWDWAYVEVTVKSPVVPIPLKAVDDAATTKVGQAVSVDVLANDSGTGLYIGWAEANIGTVKVVNGKLVYTPKAGFSGKDDFWYEVLDSSGESAWANIIISVIKQAGIYTIDGDNSDWNQFAQVIDPHNNVSLFIDDDANNLYVMVDAKQLGVNTQVFIDSDSNKATGYPLQESKPNTSFVWDAGVDLMVENSSNGQSYAGSNDDWTWTDLNSNVTVVRSGGILEMSIPKSNLKSRTKGSVIDLGFLSLDGNWQTQNILQYNYTLKR